MLRKSHHILLSYLFFRLPQTATLQSLLDRLLLINGKRSEGPVLIEDFTIKGGGEDWTACAQRNECDDERELG